MESHPSIRLGVPYPVLSIYASPGRTELRILDDDENVPSIWNSELLETISARIPSNWTAITRPDGGVEVGPESFMAPGFWDRYFDGETSAQATFREELAVLLEES
ncbi:hypothetical protein GCM10027569_09320 [Flindersiella endophytica]